MLKFFWHSEAIPIGGFSQYHTSANLCFLEQSINHNTFRNIFYLFIDSFSKWCCCLLRSFLAWLSCLHNFIPNVFIFIFVTICFVSTLTYFILVSHWNTYQHIKKNPKIDSKLTYLYSWRNYQGFSKFPRSYNYFINCLRDLKTIASTFRGRKKIC